MGLGGQHTLEQPVPAQHRRTACRHSAGMPEKQAGGADLLGVHADGCCPLVASPKVPQCCSSLLNTLHELFEALWEDLHGGLQLSSPAVESLPAAPRESRQVLRSCCLGCAALAMISSRMAYSWVAGPSGEHAGCRSRARSAKVLGGTLAAWLHVSMGKLSGMREATTSWCWAD